MDMVKGDVKPTAEESTHGPIKSATQLLNEFLSANNIELTQTQLSQSIKFVSDGAIIITKPEIGARYRNG